MKVKSKIQLETDNITEVNLMEMVRVLMNVKHATPATIIATTDVDMNKTNNPYFERVTKTQKSNVFINFDYAASVNRKLVKEGKVADFVAKPRKWGEKLTGTPLVFHNTKYYLETRFLGAEPQVEYNLDGEITDKSVFELYLKKENVKATVKNQGLEEDEIVILRDFKVENVRQLRINGTTYVRNDI